MGGQKALSMTSTDRFPVARFARTLNPHDLDRFANAARCFPYDHVIRHLRDQGFAA